MKRRRNLRRVLKYIRPKPRNWEFTSKDISESLGISESRARYYLRKLKERGYIVKLDNKNWYRVYVMKPRFVRNSNLRQKEMNDQAQLFLF